MHSNWLRQYSTMVEEGTWAWLEIKETQLILGGLPNEVVASVFANRQMYLVLANYGEKDVTIETAENFVATQKQEERVGTRWKLRPRSLLILKRQPVTSGVHAQGSHNPGDQMA